MGDAGELDRWAGVRQASSDESAALDHERDVELPHRRAPRRCELGEPIPRAEPRRWLRIAVGGESDRRVEVGVLRLGAAADCRGDQHEGGSVAGPEIDPLHHALRLAQP